MELIFDTVKTISSGKYPDIIHYHNEQAQVFSVRNGLLLGTPTEPIEMGEWGNIQYVTSATDLDIGPDSSISHFQVDKLSNFGLIGNYTIPTAHKLIIYEFALELDTYLNTGSIDLDIDSPYGDFTLDLENPDIGDVEKPGRVVLDEKRIGLMSPGAKIDFIFTIGDGPEVYMGTYFVDRSDFSVLEGSASVDGRGKIGKVLNDQTMDEFPTTGNVPLSDIINDILEHAGLMNYEYFVQNTTKKASFTFDMDMTMLAAIDDVLSLLDGWDIFELEDGTIVVGERGQGLVPTTEHYQFKRNSDIFSRDISMDDGEVYRKVIVRSKVNDEFDYFKSEEVPYYSGWSIEANKTLYVDMPDGTKPATVDSQASRIADMLKDAGKTETFDGPFRPYLRPGDEATIENEDGSKDYLGLVTKVSHNFGRQGFKTTFTIDSGGTAGRMRASDYIDKLTRPKGRSRTEED